MVLTVVEHALLEIIETEKGFVQKISEFCPKMERGLTNISATLNNELFKKLLAVNNALKPGN
jgi:hypothetical protein